MANETKQIFLWHGENDYEIFEKMAYWVAIFEKKYTGLNIFSFDLTQTGAKDKFVAEVKNALQVNSLFGMNKLIIFKNFLTATAKLDSGLKDLIVNVLKKLSAGFFVVFYQNDKPDARGVIYKEIKALEKKQLAEVTEFNLPKQSALVKWIAKKAKQHRANLSREAIDLLAVIVGSDLWQLDREMHKLANFRKLEAISAADVNLMVKAKYNDDIFQLMDALSEKNKKLALDLFQDQLDSGANEIYLLTMLTRQFRIFWQIKDADKDSNLTAEQIALELGLHPYVVKKSLSYLKGFSLEQIKKIYQRLLEFEIKIKTQSISLDLLFDLLVAEL